MTRVQEEFNAQKLMVPISITVASIALTVSVLYGLDARIDHKIKERLSPLEQKQDQLIRDVQQVSESVARIEGRLAQ